MGERIRRIWTEEDIENEVAFIQESIDSSYKNNCKERRYYPKKGAPWWYPELDKMRKICRSNFKKVQKKQLDCNYAKQQRKEYKKAIRRAKRESWQRFCSSINGPNPAARLFKLLGKDHTYSIDNIRLPDGSICDNTEEALKYLLDTHFLGNKSQIPKYKKRNYQASYEDWEIADKIVTEERVRWAISLFAPFKYISSPYTKGNRYNITIDY